MRKTILLLCSAVLWHLSFAQEVTIPSVIKGLTIILEYQDYPITESVEEISDLMNKPGYNENGNLGSVRDFYYTQTNGKVTITSTVVRVSLPETFEYYHTNDRNNVDYAIELLNQTHPEGFQGLTADPADGTLLHLNFIERGPKGGGSTNGANKELYVKNNTTEQIRINQANYSAPPVGENFKVSTICHEMGHSVMSWTDYYQTAFSNFGHFNVMSSGGTEYAPQPINPALRLQRGWIDTIVDVSGTVSKTYTLKANSYTTIHKYQNPNNPKEYLLFHALKIEGYYQSPINNDVMPEGLAIWYVNEARGYDTQMIPVGNDKDFYVGLLQADNLDEMHDEASSNKSGDLEDLYGNANKSFPNGTPFRWKDGGEFGINISNISNLGATMSFTVNGRPNTVIATSDIYGTISPKGTLSAANGQSKTFNFIPNPGYEVDAVTVNGSSVTPTNAYTMSGISGNTNTISVSFKRKTPIDTLSSPWQITKVGNTNNSDFVTQSSNGLYLETYGNTLGDYSDNFSFAYQKLNGNGTFIIHLSDYNTIPNGRTGIMIRESLNTDAAYWSLAKYTQGGAIATSRSVTGGKIADNPSKIDELHLYNLFNWLKVEKNGNYVVSYCSKDGVTWTYLGSQIMQMSTEAYIGVFTKGADSNFPSIASFDSISFTTLPTTSVSITNPATDTVLTSTTVTFNAIAAPSSIGNAITKVDFYNGSSLLGSDNTAPYSFTWEDAPSGVHIITARASDNMARTSYSAKVFVDVPCTYVDSKITGATVIGTEGSWNDFGNTREKAFDNDVNTYFDAPTDVAWTGLEMSETYHVTAVKYIPREGEEGLGRMIGGKFQGSNTADFSSDVTDLATVTSKPKNGWNCLEINISGAFKYIRYLGPSGAHGNVKEIEFYGSAQIINESPTVTITSPVTNSSFSSPTDITIAANASDADGSIVKVIFYKGSDSLGTDSVAPYSYYVGDLPVGKYSFTALAFDDLGASSSHTVTNIVVAENQLPTVAVTAPIVNTTFFAPATITITADAYDADGSVEKVDFYNGSTFIGTDYTAPYSYTWSNVAVGTYDITVKATDNNGAFTNDTVSGITINLSTADITGPACVVGNEAFLYELAASKRTNAIAYNWYFTGSSQSVTPVSGETYKVNLATGSNFSTGQLCVGVNYNVSPWYSSYCITVSECSGARVGYNVWSENTSSSQEIAVFPNPFTGETTIELAIPAQLVQVEVYNSNGKLVEKATATGSYTFGQQLLSGIYIVKINTDGNTKTVKLVKE